MVGKITSHNHEICYHAITVFESLNETIGVCNGLRKKKKPFQHMSEISSALPLIALG